MTVQAARGRLAATILVAALAMAGAASGQAGGGQGPKQVGVLTLTQQDVPRVFTLPGRAVAFQEAQIRPRVEGIVTGILYEAGRPLAAGAPMFSIEPATYQASLAQAEAAVASAAAVIPEAQAAYGRAQRLLGSGSTQVDLESARAKLDQAQAALQSAEAAADLARLQLSWTTISSPIAGVASVAGVSVGDLVTAGQATVLATVTQLDPIEVDVYETSARMLRMRAEIDAGRLQRNDKVKATLTLENGETFSGEGTMVAAGSTVSATTGSVDFRFRFPNPDNRVMPGMFVRGQVELGHFKAYLVPQMAATRGNDGVLTAYVAMNGKAELRRLTDDGTYRNQWIVREGLAEGEQLVVNGLTGLAAGAEVAPVPVAVDDQGVARDLPAEGQGETAKPAE